MLTNVIVFVFFGAFLLVPLIVSVGFIQQRKKSRRSPLTSQLLRGPGESLRAQLEIASDKLDNFFFAMMVVAAIAIVLFGVLVSSGDGKVYIWQLWSLAICYILMMAFLSLRLYRLFRHRQDLYLGLDCEQAVGQELNLLMLEGCRVFHDFQADGFNIDHIVVGSNGVFAIETKGRAKPDRGRGQEDVRVIYDGKSLQFPTWRETEPIEQTKRQAVWLSSWLSNATGDQITAKPALALPGWYVDRQAKDLVVYSGKNPKFLASINTETPLSVAMIERAVFQLDQKCRDVGPQAYMKQ